MDGGRPSHACSRELPTRAILYRAKDAGSKQLQFFNYEMNERIKALVLENARAAPLERDEFLLHFKQKVDLRTGSITGRRGAGARRTRSSGCATPPSASSRCE